MIKIVAKKIGARTSIRGKYTVIKRARIKCTHKKGHEDTYSPPSKSRKRDWYTLCAHVKKQTAFVKYQLLAVDFNYVRILLVYTRVTLFRETIGDT